MIARIAAHRYRQALTQLSAGNLDILLAAFADDVRLRFVSTTALGADVTGIDAARQWFERFRRFVPSPTFTIERVVVGGLPWRQQIAAHVTIEATVAGEPYRNEFAHFLTLAWGKVRDDLILEDTARWETACQRLIASGVTEASEAPMGGAGNVLAGQL